MPPQGEDDRDPLDLYESLETSSPDDEDEPDETDSESTTTSAPEPSAGNGDDEESDTEDTESEDEATEVDSIQNIETVVVDPDDVVELMAHNGRDGELAKGKATFVLSPPFHETMEPTIRYLDDAALDETDADDVRIRPMHFIAEGKGALEQRPTRSLARSNIKADDPTEARVDRWLEPAMETWENYLRENLRDSTQVFGSHGMVMVDIEYERREGDQ